MSTMTLFHIEADHLALMAILEECGPELTPEQDATIAAWFEEISGNEEAKLDGYVGIIRLKEADAALARAEVDRWQAQLRSAENGIARLKDRMRGFMQLTGRDRITTAAGRVIAIQRNGGKAPLQVDGAPEDLPPAYRVVEYRADNDAIRAALEEGELPFARLLPRGTQVRIR